jgi:hypothetical protein
MVLFCTKWVNQRNFTGFALSPCWNWKFLQLPRKIIGEFTSKILGLIWSCKQ